MVLAGCRPNAAKTVGEAVGWFGLNGNGGLISVSCSICLFLYLPGQTMWIVNRDTQAERNGVGYARCRYPLPEVGRRKGEKKTPSQVTSGRHVPRKIERPGSAPRLRLFQYFALEISHTRVPRQICGADAFIHRVRAAHRVSRVPPCHGLGGGSGHGGIDFDSPGASPPRCATVSS